MPVMSDLKAATATARSPGLPGAAPNPAASRPTPTLFFVGEKAAILEFLGLPVHGLGLRVETFATIGHFWSRQPVPGASCLVLDVALPGLKGLELHRIAALHRETSIILVRDRGQVLMVLRATRGGAEVTAERPDDDSLQSAIGHALECSEAALRDAAETQELRDRYAALSRREREVMALVVTGLLNKQVGGDLGISEITVKAHRGRVMRKMEARSLADLVKIAARLGLRH
ncbi:MAG: response regulator transcription factor [Hyphomicrobiaceae bacterium]